MKVGWVYPQYTDFDHGTYVEFHNTFQQGNYPVLQSTTPYYKVLLQYHFVLQSTTPVVLRTSSTAQGGGGSFKKRKTIGEIGCCESRMSKQNTDQLTN